MVKSVQIRIDMLDKFVTEVHRFASFQRANPQVQGFSATSTAGGKGHGSTWSAEGPGVLLVRNQIIWG